MGEVFVNGKLIKKGKWELGQLVEVQGNIQGDSNYIGQSDKDGKNARL